MSAIVLREPEAPPTPTPFRRAPVREPDDEVWPIPIDTPERALLFTWLTIAIDDACSLSEDACFDAIHVMLLDVEDPWDKCQMVALLTALPHNRKRKGLQFGPAAYTTGDAWAAYKIALDESAAAKEKAARFEVLYSDPENLPPAPLVHGPMITKADVVAFKKWRAAKPRPKITATTSKLIKDYRDAELDEIGKKSIAAQAKQRWLDAIRNGESYHPARLAVSLQRIGAPSAIVNFLMNRTVRFTGRIMLGCLLLGVYFAAPENAFGDALSFAFPGRFISTNGLTPFSAGVVRRAAAGLCTFVQRSQDGAETIMCRPPQVGTFFIELADLVARCSMQETISGRFCSSIYYSRRAQQIDLCLTTFALIVPHLQLGRRLTKFFKRPDGVGLEDDAPFDPIQSLKDVKAEGAAIYDRLKSAARAGTSSREAAEMLLSRVKQFQTRYRALVARAFDEDVFKDFQRLYLEFKMNEQ